MAVPALGAILPALARAVPTVVQGVARAGLAVARGAGRGLGGLGNITKTLGSLGKFLGPGGVLGKSTTLLQSKFLKLGSMLQFTGKPVGLLTRFMQSLGSSAKTLTKGVSGSNKSINTFTLALIAAIPIIGKVAQKFTSMVEGIASNIVNTLTGIPGLLQSRFSGIISLIKSYSPAQARQIEIAFGQLRATMGQVLAPLAPMIRNFVLNIARFIKDGLSKIDIKKAFKWIVFFMFFTIAIIVGIVKLIIRIIKNIQELFRKGISGILIGLGILFQRAIMLVVKFAGFILRNIPVWLMMILRLIIRAFLWLLKQIPKLLVTLIKAIPKLMAFFIQILIQIGKDLLIGAVKAIFGIVPFLLEEGKNLVLGLFNSLKEGVLEFFSWVREGISGLIGWLGRRIKGLLSWFSSDEGEGKAMREFREGMQNAVTNFYKQMNPKLFETPVDPNKGVQKPPSAKPEESKGDSAKKESGTPEKLMQDMSNFFKELGMEEVGQTLGDMANLFENLFKEADTTGLAFEAKEGVTTSIEDIGKKAREAALGVSGDPQEKTAKESEKTSGNTKEISEGVKELVNKNPSNNVEKLTKEAEFTSKEIDKLGKSSNRILDVQEKGIRDILLGIEEMIYHQRRGNRLIAKMVLSQREMAEFERAEKRGFERLKP